MPLVSIIVPIYKVPEEYLRRCIESCQRQSLSDIEILLVEDGSPDGCGRICDGYGEADGRIRVIHKENGGLCSARNAGFLASRGRWVMFVDGDDWIDADMCERMYRAGEDEDVDLVMCGITREYGRSSVPYRFYLRPYTEVSTTPASGGFRSDFAPAPGSGEESAGTAPSPEPEEEAIGTSVHPAKKGRGKVYRGRECRWLRRQLLVYNANIAVAYSKLIRRSLLAEGGILHDEELRQGAEGLEFNFRLFGRIRSALFLDVPFYHYIYNENSISSSHSEENHRYVLACFEKIRAMIEADEDRDRLLPWFYNRLLYVIVTTAVSGYFNPDNRLSFSEKKRGFREYLENPMVGQALRSDNLRGLSKQRLAVLCLIRGRQYRALDLMGRMRRWQKGRM